MATLPSKAASAKAPEAPPIKKTIFVLVHGAFHGGWCWQRVAPILRAAGHEVFTPTLTGLGERAHLVNPEIGLNTHVQDILAVLEYEDLWGVVLVGHSYAGLVITAVADQAAERLAHLVYLDGPVPQDGESSADLLGPEFMAGLRQAAQDVGEGWRIPPPPGEVFGITSDADVAWVQPRLVDQPLKTFEEPVRLTKVTGVALPRTFIYCNKPALGFWDRYAEMARAADDWGYHELATGHDAMILKPQELAHLLLEMAAETKKKR